jgi:hypothetical protein
VGCGIGVGVCMKWIKRKEWDDLQRRVCQLEWDTKILTEYGSFSVAEVVRMTLAHLKVDIHVTREIKELCSKGGPEKP